MMNKKKKKKKKKRVPYRNSKDVARIPANI